ncbi:MAG TPA: alpha/beta fold hydrolase [Bacteroidota bacterium]|nr:alpha/beta fold hydrolase [Bacteroidota bacterium]
MKASVNNALIHYVDIGISTGVPVVFVHGFPFSHKMWTFPGGQTEALAATHRVIAYDVRGHGESEVGDGQYTIELFVDDLIGLLDHLSIAKAVLVGLSMGGYIVLRAIERNPDRVRGLVLCDTKSDADSNEAKIKRAASIKGIKANGPRVFAENFVAGVFTPESFTSRPEAVKAIQSTIERTAPLSLCGATLALAARTDTTHVLSGIGVPTLIMVGERDLLTPPAVSEAMKEKIPNSELHVLPNAAHMSNIENAPEFNRHLLEFLQKVA